MDTKTPISPIPMWLSYIVCYVAWLACAAGGVWILLELRNTLIDFTLFINTGPWIMGALDKFGILLLGIAWLALVLAAEHYLRQGVERCLLWPRIARIAVIEAVVLGAAFGLQWLMR